MEQVGLQAEKWGRWKLTQIKGLNRCEGVSIDERGDFDEIFTLVVKMTSIRTVLGIATSINMEIEQLDVKTTFLPGELDEEIYIK